ncbi:hypothetical protein ABT282_08790 [Streptomyces sp. NPDC000927]|uniref:hypothetical protein n=1 Tax=Streptomyces sp. NPDC000927 TaxID=3154371 RepID=UPI0033185603
MNNAWPQIIGLNPTTEHLELCDKALLEVQKTAQVRTLRFVANALSEMAGNKVSTMDAVDIVNLARDLILTAEPGASVETALKDAQANLGLGHPSP